MNPPSEIPSEFNTAKIAREAIRLIAAQRGIEITEHNITQVMLDNPDMNHLRLVADEWQYGYRREADSFRSMLTKEQRRSWKACGPYKINDKVNEVYSNRSAWLCWLRRRAGNSLSLPMRLRKLINAEYHHLTVAEMDEMDKNASKRDGKSDS